jgi:hypothetical protein
LARQRAGAGGRDYGIACHSLDLSAIEHEALNLASPELESLNKMLATERSRFDETVKRAEELDQSFAEQLERSGNNILEDNDDVRTSSPDDQPYPVVPMTSQRKIEANRLNGAKSRGPKSAAGKSRSSKNAVTHGLTSKATRDDNKLAAEKLAHQIMREEGVEDLDLAVGSPKRWWKGIKHDRPRSSPRKK